ncbi:MAG: efflux RND transporter permease subunit [Myxococcales bacterium]
MKAFELFIRRPVGTCLFALALTLPGAVAFFLLPVASLPQVDMPVINVSAQLPGASPETMAATVATPLERVLGRIAGVTEMTSTSSQGSTRVSLQFDLARDVDSAARDVQSAISAASALLPPNLPSPPIYRKANSASGPVLAIALTSPTRTQDQLYDVAFTNLGQRIAQVAGVGQVQVNGSSIRSVRIEVNPQVLTQRGLSLEQLRTALSTATADLPKGFIESKEERYLIHVRGKLARAQDYRDLIVRSTPAGVVRLSDVATIRDSVQELRNAGSSGGKPAVLLAVINQPGANIVQTVDAVKDLLREADSLVPADVEVKVVVDRSTTIRRSLREVEETLLLSIGLVVLVAFLFLRSARATIIPSVAIPVSLLGTLAIIYLCGFTLNNLSLMALIISTGFVVDDAIVVLENAVHHMERGLDARSAALRAVRNVGFTVVAMSVSLVAVFIPLLLMDGVVGRLFREFAVTLSIAVLLSMLVSLVVTPMLCAQLLRPPSTASSSSWVHRVLDAVSTLPERVYALTLGWALGHPRLMLTCLLGSVWLSVHLYQAIPKSFFPQQDTGRLQGIFRADQNIGFAAMRQKVAALMRIVGNDPDVDTFYEYGGGAAGNQFNTGSMFAQLRPRAERTATAEEVVQRLRPRLSKVPGVALLLSAQQDVNIGARQGAAQYQYTLLSSDLPALQALAPRFRGLLAKLPELTDVTSDFQDRGLATQVSLDRDRAAELGISARDIDATLNDAFGQRIVSTIYEPLNQYYVVLAVEPELARGPEALKNIYLPARGEQPVPLHSLAHWSRKHAPLAVNHQGQFAAATLSFNLAPGVSLERAARMIETTLEQASPTGSVWGTFAGSMQAFLSSLDNQPWLILSALVAVYLVLGMLYESLLHPLTILSTLPSAGVGALLALRLMDESFSVIALIGLILLVGIVKKNAIMLIDCALQLERTEHLTAAESIRRACLERFRPILMTTLAALLGALPLALGAGDGAELRRPLGISIVGGLLLSQVLTLYTTPVVYLVLHRLGSAWGVWRGRRGATNVDLAMDTTSRMMDSP